MAERAPPPVDETHILNNNDDGDDDVTAAISPPEKPKSTDEEKLFSRPTATYVVQVPKDQIYRVPPPENAAIAERRHKPTSDASRRHRHRLRPCASRCCCVILTLAFFSVLLVLALTLVPAFIYPKEPSFQIERVEMINHARAIRVALRSENPNARVDMSYAQGGVVSLHFRGKEIAAGKFPAFYHAHGSSAAFETVLRERGALPNGTRFTLRMSNLSARTEVMTWRTGTVWLEVSCDLKVDSLAGKDGARVLSQSCRTT